MSARGTVTWRQLLVVVLLAWLSTGASADDERGGATRITGQRLGGDLFIGGARVAVREPVSGDVFAAGGNIDIDAAIGGDALLLGGQSRIGADIAQSVYAAGGQVTLNGKVAHNLRAAGGQVELGTKSDVGGNASLAGGQVRLNGSVRGDVQAAGARVVIDGSVGGDVLVTSGQLELGPNARIAGKLRYRSKGTIDHDPAAQAAGGIEMLAWPMAPRETTSGAHGRRWNEREHRGGAALAGIGLWTVGLIVLAAVLLATTPRVSRRIATTLRERTGLSLLLGFAVLVCAPVAVLLLTITVIGIPLALFAISLYFALLPLAYVWGAYGIGQWVLDRWLSAHAASTGWRIAAVAVALLTLALLGMVPVLGWLLGLAVMLAGLGALILQLRRTATSNG